jgi:hypothetical protein
MKNPPRSVVDELARLKTYTRHARVTEGWGDHPKTFIDRLRGDTQECVEFCFKDPQKDELRRELSRVRKADDAAIEAFIERLEWAMTGSIASRLVCLRARDGNSRNAQLIKNLHARLGAVLGPLREAISPDRWCPLPMHPNGRGFLPLEFVMETLRRVEFLHQSYGRSIKSDTERKCASKNRGGRPREWTRREFIKQAAEDYRAHFTAWPSSTRDGPFLAVLRIALKAVSPQVPDPQVHDLYKEVRRILRDLKGSTSL